jgi:hypothetical protein
VPNYRGLDLSVLKKFKGPLIKGLAENNLIKYNAFKPIPTLNMRRIFT